MELVLDNDVVPHAIFAEATSVEHFVELLRGYHAELMNSRPAHLRYELEISPPRLSVYSPDHPESCLDTTWGEYSFRMTARMPMREGKPFETINHDFPFLQILSSQGTGKGGRVNDAEEVHGFSHDLECFPKIHAQFMELQDLNAKHAQHVYEMDRQTQSAFTADTELETVRRKLETLRVAVWSLEREEKAHMDRIRTNVNASNPEPYAAEREALLQQFQAA